MIQNKKNNLPIYKNKLSKITFHNINYQSTITFSKKKPFKNILPEFFDWLKMKVVSGDKKFSLDAQDLILYKPSTLKEQFVFILPEVLEQYYEYSGIPKNILQIELKKKLMITFSYIITRNEQIIEVFPCHKFF